MSTVEQMSSQYWSHLPDAAATGDGRVIAGAILALADEVQLLRQAIEAAR